MNKNKGFNIIEVAMSIMVISIAILMITAIYTNIIQVQAKGVGKTIASSVAERVLQNIITNHISDVKIKINNGSSSADSRYELIGKDIVNNNVYYYYSAIYKSSNNAFKDTSIAKADVYVYWDLGENTTETDIKQLTTQTDVKNSVRFSRFITFSEED